MDEINSYDIEKIYSDMEKYLIANIKRNLTDDLNSFHKKEEKEYGFEWEAWQSAKLRSMQKFRKQNKDIINGRTKNINKMIAKILKNEAMQGRLNAFKGYKEALVHGYKSSVTVKDSFFKMNSRKVRALIKSTTNDFTKANHATLRRSNDVYRQIIAEASMYNQSGVMTPKQAIRKAIQEFEKRGINSIEYSNGAKHKISDYTSMAIKTASTRAMLTGEGELRKKIGSTLILMSKHNTACKLCQPWENKVLIDDVYSGGSKEDGNYPLLSQAMKEGLYHPNCKHGHGTYFPELSKDINHKIIDKVESQEEIKKEIKPTKTNEKTLSFGNSSLKQPLTEQDKNVLNYYVMDAGAYDINYVLRNNVTPTENDKRAITDLTNAINKSVLNKNIDVYRYISNENVFYGLKEGDIYEDKGFMSTTFSETTDRESNYADYKVKVVINAKKGDNALDVSPIFDKQAYEGEEEREIIFNKNQKMKLIKVETIRDKYDEFTRKIYYFETIK